MAAENPKLAHYLSLVHAAESSAFVFRVHPQAGSGASPHLIRTGLAAYEAGLTLAEILAAVEIGNYREEAKHGTQPICDSED